LDAVRPEITQGLLRSELDFYQRFSWCLNPIPTVEETVAHLDEELARLQMSGEAWHMMEVMTNIFLLSCTILNSIEDYVYGPTYCLPKRASKLPFANMVNRALAVGEKLNVALRWPRIALASKWKEQWLLNFDNFLRLLVCETLPQSEILGDAAHELSSLLHSRLPTDLGKWRIRIPSAFRKQDLSHVDILALGRKFAACFPDRRQPLLVTGLRTAGSYFAPLLRAFLKSEGYQVVDMVTIRPNHGLAIWERAKLKQRACQQYMAVLVDDPPFSGGTIRQGVEQLRKAGFGPSRLAILFPVRPVGREWSDHFESTGFLNESILCLEPEEWYKQRLLAPKVAEVRLREYFQQRGYVSTTVIANPIADELNARLVARAGVEERDRLKRIFAVRLEPKEGPTETRYVLAKSVGWGVFGYSAFLAGFRLAQYVPPLLGLRDGILYTQWFPQTNTVNPRTLDRSHWIERLAIYVATRANSLTLGSDPTPSLGLDSQHEGFRVLVASLCGAYGSVAASRLMRGRIRRQLANRICPSPALIDGKMSPSEWIAGPSGPLKTDFEHHGFGKHELNISDPAYDLADAILQFELSPAEERRLIRRYVEMSGDAGVKDRLFFNKLIAGCWLMASSSDRFVKQPQADHRSAEFNEQYGRAWGFLTKECARFCGALCDVPQSPEWRSPLVVVDIDGVLDRRVFGFPTTTAAGIRALRWLHAHGVAVAVDTARSAREVKEYCRTYGLVGGVAEYGSYVFDAVANKGTRLVNGEALEQLRELRQALQQVPGVFLHDGYEYSIRAYTYGRNGTIALPSAMLPNLISRLKLNRLRWLQTTIDTTILARDVNKGRGLKELLYWAGHPDLKTVAIGDSEPDLAMFRAADRSFAPGHVGCRDLVRAVGGQIARDPYQLGLLCIVRSLVHPEGDGCRLCPPNEIEHGAHDRFFLDLLEAADQKPLVSLFRALLHPTALRVIVQN
jgi:hydroxymethylpyrimidine pyrophosphatase-like HAD family hydrolase